LCKCYKYSVKFLNHAGIWGYVGEYNGVTVSAVAPRKPVSAHAENTNTDTITKKRGETMTQYTVKLSEEELITIESALMAQIHDYEELLKRNEELVEPITTYLAIAADNYKNALMVLIEARRNEVSRIAAITDKLREELFNGNGSH
jgi:hypothetical protein